MTFEEMLDHAMALLQRRGRVTYRMLKVQFQMPPAVPGLSRRARFLLRPQLLTRI